MIKHFSFCGFILLPMIASVFSATSSADPADPANPEEPIADIAEQIENDEWSLNKLTVRSLSAYWDDDGTYVNIVNDEDRYYSSGQGLEVSFDPNFTDDIRSKLASSDDWGDDTRFGLGFAIKQHIYTGIDITDPAPALDDHPYGGYLYFAFSFQRSDKDKHDHFELDLGVIGERSQAEAVQRFIHNAFPDNDTPQGWGTQLPNEITLNLTFERTWRSRKGNIAGLEFDMLPAVGFDVGTVFVRARGRATIRVGKALPDDFGPATFLGHKDHTARGYADPDQKWSIYGYITIGADAVAHNAFLDGTVFTDSRSVESETLVSQVTFGLIGRYKQLEIGWSQTWQSKEFETQVNGQTWGSLALIYYVEF
jgi:lipid A 3-O-deacylase